MAVQGSGVRVAQGGPYDPAGGQRLDLAAGAVGDDEAVADQDDPVGVQVGLFEVVRREQHRTTLLGVLADGRPERAATLHVHAGRGLVEQEQRRVGEQRHREAQSLLLAAGALGHPAVGDADDAGALEHGVDRLGVGEQARGVLNGLADREVLEQPARLHHGGDQAARDGLPRLHPEDLDVTVGGARETQDHVDRGRLPGAVGPEERDHLARFDLEVDPSNRMHVPEVLGDPREPYCGCAME